MAQNNNPIDLLPSYEDEIKNYHIMIEYFGLIGSEYLNLDLEDEQDLDSDLKWIKFSDLFKAFGHSSKVFSENKCRARFYKFSAFYAKNYDKLNDNLEIKTKKIFNSLKIVHILDLNNFWIFDNSTHTLLRGIALKPEIKEYINKKTIELNVDKKRRNEVRAKWKSLNEKSVNYSTFEGMNLKDDLIRGIKALNYKEPSTVQQRAIVACIIGRDVIAQAQSGTGKTAAFAIAILQTIDTSINKCQALILAPTHELARQILRDIKELGKYMTVRYHLSIGGTDVRQDESQLRTGLHHVVVGTPGRVLDMLQRGALNTDSIKLLVLDECDFLLDLNLKIGTKRIDPLKSFKIPEIYELLSPSIQVFLASATMPPEIASMTQSFMKSPLKILVKNDELTLRSLKQYYVNTGQEGFKFNTFCEIFERIIKHESFKSGKAQMFVYCNYKQTVNWLVNMLESKGITVANMHGDSGPNQRESILRDFRMGWSRVLVTTDLLGRGIDVVETEFVINYDLPLDRESYMHRVGRAGRFAGLFGHTGKAITFVTEPQMQTLNEIESFYHTQIEELPEDISCLF